MSGSPSIEPTAVAAITPTPTDEEAAAIAAALTMAWPRPAATEQPREVPTRWRFSGRWWNRPTWGDWSR